MAPFFLLIWNLETRLSSLSLSYLASSGGWFPRVNAFGETTHGDPFRHVARTAISYLFNIYRFITTQNTSHPFNAQEPFPTCTSPTFNYITNTITFNYTCIINTIDSPYKAGEQIRTNGIILD